MNNTTNELGLQGLAIKNITEDEISLSYYAETIASQQICPSCRKRTTRIHGYRTQKIKDLPSRLKSVAIFLKKRRYVCECGHTFFEKYSFLPKYRRATSRFFMGIINQFYSLRSFKEIASQFNVSSNTVYRMLNLTSPSVSNVLPEVLGIDEFKGNTDKEKYQCILTDINNKRIFDILPCRNKSYLIQYFKKFKNRDKVKYFVMDMTNNYKCLSWLFSNAEIVTDKFHFIRQVYWAMDNVRKRVQKEFAKTKRIYFKHSRKLLATDYDKLKDDNKEALEVILNQSETLRRAWEIKESFKDVRNATTKKQAEKELLIWILEAEDSKIPEFKPATTAFHNWSRYIVNALASNYSNGFTEGMNNKIKVLKRNAFGFKKFNIFRKRILLATAKN